MYVVKNLNGISGFGATDAAAAWIAAHRDECEEFGVNCQPPPPAPPKQPQLTQSDVCKNYADAWMKQHPELARCMNDADKKLLIDICVKAALGQVSSTMAKALLDKMTKAACDRVAKANCDAFYTAYVKANPQYAKCFVGKAKDQALAVCQKAAAGAITQAQATQQIHDIIEAACTPKVQTPPKPPTTVDTPVPTKPPSTTATDTPIDKWMDPGPSDGDVPLQASEPSGIHKWGPIVGVALLLAGGIWYVRKK